ncbi:MAG: GNAT family N-acetyltransferase [Candidatus Saccharimonadales bacterium]
MVKVRPYSSQDYSALSTLYKDKRAYGGTFDESRDEPTRLLKTSEAGNLYVAEDDRHIVGSFMILDNPHSFWLLRCVIRPSDNEMTIAQTLFECANSIARERGHDSMIVYTDPEDEKLNTRYSEQGFNKASSYRCYWKEVV